MGGGAEPGLADLPQLLLVGRIVEEGDIGIVLGLVQAVEHAVGVFVGVLEGLPAELRHQEGLPLGEFGAGLRVEVLDPLVPEES